jgi:hypothetical protein
LDGLAVANDSTLQRLRSNGQAFNPRHAKASATAARGNSPFYTIGGSNAMQECGIYVAD